jgi:poly-gamma-glutamate capsule biosynthesis protein CapA/YwtB (metallophosphatase superfamily)
VDQQICLFVCGDVMTGRGIDQILPHPSDPRLCERFVRDARDYVRLAELTSGRIPRGVPDDYIWGDALAELDRAGTDVRLINLETSITTSDDCWPDKEVYYRMNPQNVECLTAAKIDCCALANNHVLDWGYDGLAQTLATLDEAGIQHAGAGANAATAQAPAVVEVAGTGRVLVFSFGSTTSGIPPAWAAAQDRPGVNLLPDLSEQTGRRTAVMIRDSKGAGDFAVASLHWGSNWGYEIPPAQVAFAHHLIDGGVDLVHGHSSHHFKAFEAYNGHAILYGCGDFLTDYEGIHGYEAYRSDLAVMYFCTSAPPAGELVELRLVPMHIKRFRLNHASPADVRWSSQTLNREGTQFGTSVSLCSDNSLRARLGPAPTLRTVAGKPGS